MEIDAALNLCIRVLEVVGKAGDAREFMPRHGVEVCVAAAGVDGAVTDPDVGEAVGIVRTDWNVTGCVGHVVVDAVIPLQCDHGVEVAEARERVRYASHAGHRKRTKPGRQRAVEGRPVSTEHARDADGQLAAQHRCGEGIGRGQEHEVRRRIQIDIQADIDGREKRPT